MKKFVCLILTLVMSLSLVACGGSGERDVNECGSCGKKYYAGDAGGNYMKIATSGMCKRCYSNFKSTREALDYYDLNK